MSGRTLSATLAVALTVVACLPAAAQEVNVYTYREPALIKPLLDAFTRETGVKVGVIFAREGLEERIAAEGARSPADALLTTDASRLVRAVELGVTRPIRSAVLEQTIDPALRDPAGHWFALSYRARVAYVSKDRVKDATLTYEDLANPRWKGRLCSRDGQHVYNNMLFAAAVAHMGAERAEAWVRGLKANLAKRPSGGDREVAKDIASGLCDIGLGNTYYVGLMLNKSAEQKPWGEAIRVILPKFAGGGTHVNLSGIAIMKHAPNAQNALRLAEWLAGPTAQAMYTAENFEFPVRKETPVDPTIANFGALVPDTLPFEAIIKARGMAADIVDRTGFNAGPGS